MKEVEEWGQIFNLDISFQRKLREGYEGLQKKRAEKSRVKI